MCVCQWGLFGGFEKIKAREGAASLWAFLAWAACLLAASSIDESNVVSMLGYCNGQTPAQRVYARLPPLPSVSDRSRGEKFLPAPGFDFV
jgi:hypothetical protein